MNIYTTLFHKKLKKPKTIVIYKSLYHKKVTTWSMHLVWSNFVSYIQNIININWINFLIREKDIMLYQIQRIDFKNMNLSFIK